MHQVLPNPSRCIRLNWPIPLVRSPAESVHRARRLVLLPRALPRAVARHHPFPLEVTGGT